MIKSTGVDIVDHGVGGMIGLFASAKPVGFALRGEIMPTEAPCQLCRQPYKT